MPFALERPLSANSGRTERISLDTANARLTDSTANPRENVTQSIVARDAHGLRYIFVNRAAEKLFGIPDTRLRFTHCVVLRRWGNRRKLGHPDDGWGRRS
jgi:PAS domain-containing protein